MYYIHMLARVYMHVLVHNRKTCVQDSSITEIVCPLEPTNNQSLGVSNDYNDYNRYNYLNDYDDYNEYNEHSDYRDSDFDLDSERFSELMT